ncbi:MAG: hypothetical protein ABR961_15295 [Thermoanaerobaculaceae bacterium]|jgi:hypothetical protein
MKSNRFALFALIMVALVGLAACGSNSTSKTEGDVFLTDSVPIAPTSVDMATSGDVVIPNMTISSHAKSQTAILSTQDDVNLTQLVVTCTRTDGGTVASPQWTNSVQLYVPAGGSVTVQNYPIFPAEYFQQPPLNQLLFPNGTDKETGNSNIRQDLHMTIYGKEISGKNVSLSFDLTLNFYYQ